MDDAARRWIERHPYLEGVAAFHEAISSLAAGLPRAPAPLPEIVDAELGRGMPMLLSEQVGLLDRPEPGEAVAKLAAAAAAAEIPAALRTAAAALRDALAAPGARGAFLGWLVRGGEAPAGVDPGLARFVGWTALTHALAPAIDALVPRLGGEVWKSGSCPTCAAPASMAQLLPAGEDRKRRFLACGQCRTRWSHRRIACPHCGNEDATKLAVLELEDEPTLRLDVCEACRGYVKTYDGEADAALVLSDWPTLHLDVLASENGYQRKGPSLYELAEDAEGEDAGE
jgi:FdhE protein